jgi:hypothetical protein
LDKKLALIRFIRPLLDQSFMNLADHQMLKNSFKNTGSWGWGHGYSGRVCAGIALTHTVRLAASFVWVVGVKF